MIHEARLKNKGKICKILLKKINFQIALAQLIYTAKIIANTYIAEIDFFTNSYNKIVLNFTFYFTNK